MAPAWRGFWRSARIGVGLVAAIASVWPAAGTESELAPVAAAKPSFSLDDLDLRPVLLADQRGDIVIVHFFATWCEPCREELPALNRLAARSEPGRLRILSISVAEPEARIRNFLDKLPVRFPVLLDRDRQVAKSWNVSALPTTFILDRRLRARLMVEREYDWDRIDPDRLLASFDNPQSAASDGKPREE